ncbi:hypothetical protein SAMN05444392_101348 [Seinonella peptonophila]|uniref:Zinc-ribbon domain-containing protein n=1 Tax=Seinonella peptonophila TaxID=112248 RepID=A0A1M4T7F8_9BACL|nr:hypothetical protein [Seinonella peptonophila]SHE40463.1 hypothetical protein SAMN05444392_101348 [Seinonella peptonophila]
MGLDNYTRPSGGRLVSRPRYVEQCIDCNEPLGINYISCRACYHAIENIWLQDWYSLLEKEDIEIGSKFEKLLAEVIWGEMDQHPWTIVDSALSHLYCKVCSNELGSQIRKCYECETVYNNIWGYDYEAMGQGMMMDHEHALRVGRWVLRFPHSHSKYSVVGWKFSIPLVLTGKLPSKIEAQQTMSWIKENFCL